ncbi:MAG: amino acid permease [Phycisphaerae bacterium]|nr:amino acid permease [Phycisphaerae bacterium]
MLTSTKRPRNLAWYHAGALLFGDWGTSRLYVLGLAFFYTAHATPMYLAAMSVLMVAVAWAYSIICRNFTEGGGVYATARQISPLLSVIGATLLLCDYIVTASLSVMDGMHYLGVPENLALAASIACILIIGLVNWFGARSAGRLALVIAVGALVASILIALLCIRFVPAGLETASTGHPSMAGGWTRWESFVRIVLALSGVEAVANMTGLMKEPVVRTSRRTIWPVLAEVVLFNLIFAVALSGLPRMIDIHQPDFITHAAQPLPGAAAPLVSADPIPSEVKEYRDTAMKVLAREGMAASFGSQAAGIFASIVGVLFGLLLISAANTAIGALAAVQYSLGRDRELPKISTQLNYSGVPWFSLIIGCAAPIGVLLITSDVAALADLYAVGVCGAITISILSCAFNKRLAIGVWERRGLWLVGGVMFAIELTILTTKPHATLFAGSIVGAVLISRWAVVWQRSKAGPLLEPEQGWLPEIDRPLPVIDPSSPRVMFAARGRYISEFAVDYARRRKATLFAMYVRTLRVVDAPAEKEQTIADDEAALETLGTTMVLAKKAGVPCIPIYVVSPNIAEEILDYTTTYACDTLILGKTRRGAVSRALAGDVVAEVARHLPDDVALITRENTPHV